MQKTLAMKLLEGKRVPYEAVAYPDTIHDAEEVAVVLEVPAGQVFKTLVVLPPAGAKTTVKALLVMVPANRQLDLKKVAKSLNVKKVQMATQRQAEELTGLQVGGISALALLNKGFSTFLDTSAQAYDSIYVSAGERGLNLKVAVADLLKITRARLIDAVS